MTTNTMMRPLIYSWAAMMVIAALINDSAILIPLIATGFLVPVLVSYAAEWLSTNSPKEMYPPLDDMLL